MIFTIPAIIIALFVIVYATVLAFASELLGRPKKFHCTSLPPKDFLIKKDNPIGMQTGPECSGFSAAFVLRHFGIDADGFKVYDAMPKAMKDGAVVPKGIIQFFTKEGFHISYYKGNLKNLEEAVSRGTPVIILIRTDLKNNWLHYVPVVGYDQENFYIADSFKDTVNANARYYNRVVSKDLLKKLWKTNRFYMPFFTNIFMIVEKNS